MSDPNRGINRFFGVLALGVVALGFLALLYIVARLS